LILNFSTKGGLMNLRRDLVIVRFNRNSYQGTNYSSAIMNEQEGNILQVAYLEADNDVCFFNTFFFTSFASHHLARCW
jgi:hypothetical protein